MLKHRVIPVLLLQNEGLVKTVKFKDSRYVGDPINAIRIFNDKEVDELVFLDISAYKTNKEIDYHLIAGLASECFMPLCYGGGIKDVDSIRKILHLGVEKVSINTQAFENPDFIKDAVRLFGSSTIVISLDVKKNLWGNYEVWTHGGTKNTKISPFQAVKMMENLGAGEILLNSIDKDGTMMGYDLKLIEKASNLVQIPLIAAGGASKISDFSDAIKHGASAVSAGSMFVFHGKHKAVLITYPGRKELSDI